MADEPRVQQLLDEIFDTGRAPEEVCRGCPELLPHVRRRWRQMRAVEAELEALFPTPGRPPAVDTPAPGSPGGDRPPMPVQSAADLVEALRLCKLLEPAQAAELARLQETYPEPRTLATALIHRDWLTPYQANLLLRGRGSG